MEDKLFVEPFFVKAGKYSLQEIASVIDAIDFLEEWPWHRRTLMHEAALDTCYAAHDGRKPVDSARRAFREWAKGEDLLSDLAVPGWMIAGRQSGNGAST